MNNSSGNTPHNSIDPSLRDSRIDTIFVAANGLNFELDQMGDGDRLAICLHGFPESSFSWRHQLPLLSELGYKAWAPNLRGYGRTSRPLSIKDYAMPHLLEDVAALIDASGCQEVVMLAHDWGAIIAWQFAMQQVRPLQKLVICNVPHPAPMQRELRSFAQLRKSWYLFFFQIPWLPEVLLGRNNAKSIAAMILNSAELKERFPQAVLEVYRRNAVQPGALTAMLNYYRALLRDARQQSGDWPKIEIPTLMIWGEEDIALGKATTVGTEQWVPNLTLRYLPGISHWVQQEAPEVVNAMIAAFLNNTRVPEMHALGNGH